MIQELKYYDGSIIEEMVVEPVRHNLMKINIFTKNGHYNEVVNDGFLRVLWGKCYGNIFRESDTMPNHIKLFQYVKEKYIDVMSPINVSDSLLKELFFGEEQNE